MTSSCSTSEMICVQCGDRGFTNAFVYCVKCLKVAVHRYCLDVIPNTTDEFVQWFCDDCGAKMQNQPAVQSKTRDHSTYSNEQDMGWRSTLPGLVRPASPTQSVSSSAPTLTPEIPTPFSSPSTPTASSDPIVVTTQSGKKRQTPNLSEPLEEGAAPKKGCIGTSSLTRKSNELPIPDEKIEKRKPHTAQKGKRVFSYGDKPSASAPKKLGLPGQLNKSVAELTGPESLAVLKSLCNDDVVAELNSHCERDLAHEAIKYSLQVTFIRPTLAHLKTQMTLYNRSDMLEEILQELSKTKENSTELLYGDALQLVKSSQFGYLFEFTAAYYANRRAMHALLCRQVKVTDPALVDRELHFFVSGKLLTFGPTEFNMVTGLRMGRSRVDPTRPAQIPEQSLYMRCFQKNKIYLGEVRRRFLTSTYRHMDSGDVAKIAQILIVYYMVFCYDNPKKRVDDWIWAIVDDEVEWNAFPWGAYAFQILMHYVGYLPRVRTDFRGGSKDGSYHFFGPSWVLMVWMVESLPELVGQILKVIDGAERLPRCLKYQSCDTKIDFTRFFDRNVHVCLMVPTPEEVEAPYFYRDGGDPIGVGFTKPISKASKKFMEKAAKAIQTSITCARADDVEPTRHPTRSEQQDADETMFRGSKRRRTKSRSHSNRETSPSRGLFEKIKEYMDDKITDVKEYMDEKITDAVRELKGYIDQKFKSAQ